MHKITLTKSSDTVDNGLSVQIIKGSGQLFLPSPLCLSGVTWKEPPVLICIKLS